MKSSAPLIFATALLLGLLSLSAPGRLGADDGSRVDDKTYYWQGSQLNNLGRLGQASPDFEKDQKRQQADQYKEEYLTSIREQISHQAAANKEQKTMLITQGKLPVNPLEVTYGQTGVNVTLRIDKLFEENSTSLRVGAMDTLDRLTALLQSTTQKELHLVALDPIEDTPDAARIDAERSQMVFGLLHFSLD